jgi:Glycosyltransferase like family 2
LVEPLPWDEIRAQVPGRAHLLGVGVGVDGGSGLPTGWSAGEQGVSGAGPVVLVAPVDDDAMREAHEQAGDHRLVVVLANLARPALIRALLVGHGDDVLPGIARAGLTRGSVDQAAKRLGRRPVPDMTEATLPTGRPLDDFLAEVVARAGGHDRAWTVRAYDAAELDEDDAERPFLSVLVRTQGRRGAELADVLICLAAQSCDDFEVLLLPHDAAQADREVLDDMVSALATALQQRVRVLPVDGGGRSRPLTIGIARARGRYIAVLDDDDLVLGHWVAAFRDAALRAPGMILRSVTVEQTMELEAIAPGFRAVSWPTPRWDAEFSLLSHLVDNHSPVHGCAYPREVFHELGLGFDEALPVLEDWDLLVRAASLVGVHDTGEVTAIYRRWPAARNSFAHLAEDSWPETAWRVVTGWDRSPLLLPTGSATRLRTEGIYLLEHRPIRERVVRRIDRWRDIWSARLMRTEMGRPVRWLYRRIRPRTLSPE